MEISIKTKFNPGDTAYRFNPSTNKLEEYHVKKVYIITTSEETLSIGYFTDDSYDNTPEKDLFASKEEFINQL